MALPLAQALAEAQAATRNVEEWIRAVNRRKVEYALLQQQPRADVRYLYDLAGEALGFLGRQGEFDEAKRFIAAMEAWEEALANVACAHSDPTDLEQMHDGADDTPDYLR